MNPQPLTVPQKILVVEHLPDNLRLLVKILTANGYQVQSATDGKTTVEMIRKNQPNLILLDPILPDLDGEKFCQQLTSSPSTAHIPILLLTYIDQERERLKAFQLGAVDYIAKPYQREEILAKVKTQLKILELQHKLQIADQDLAKFKPIDPVTGLFNRYRFDEYLAQEWRRGARERISLGDISQTSLSLILCQIDNFQDYEKQQDQETVNNCLKKLAEVLRLVVKRPADYIARYGNNKFAILLPNTDIDGAVQVASYIKQKTQLIGQEITLSMGIINRIPTQALSPESLVISAQNLLYEAQTEGGDCIITDSD